MFLSFIVPVYNTEKYLAECLDSLLSQDIPYDDYEIICVNDGSNDGSLDILLGYEQKYNNVIIIDQLNGGVCRARNAGLELAKGEYIWFFDSDDIVARNILGKIKDTLRDNPVDRLAVGCYTFAEYFTEEEQKEYGAGALQVNSYFADSNVIMRLLRRDFLLQNNLFFKYPSISHGEDSLFMFEFKHANPRLASFEGAVYFYRTRPDSAQNGKTVSNHKKRVQSYWQVLMVVSEYCHAHRNELTSSDADMLMTFVWYVLNDAAQSSFTDTKKKLRSLKEKKLYPYVRPDACTLKKSYQTTRSDAFGKLFEFFYLHMHRPWGFWSMWVLQRLIALKHRLRKRGVFN